MVVTVAIAGHALTIRGRKQTNADERARRMADNLPSDECKMRDKTHPFARGEIFCAHPTPQGVVRIMRRSRFQLTSIHLYTVCFCIKISSGCRLWCQKVNRLLFVFSSLGVHVISPEGHTLHGRHYTQTAHKAGVRIHHIHQGCTLIRATMRPSCFALIHC